MVAQLLYGLAHLKQNNIVHSDIKPANIMVQKHNLCGAP